MLTGAIRSQVGQVWTSFWSGGIVNPLTVIEQITYLLFAKSIDDRDTNRDPGKPNNRKAKSFFVPADETRVNKYDLSINRYK